MQRPLIWFTSSLPSMCATCQGQRRISLICSTVAHIKGKERKTQNKCAEEESHPEPVIKGVRLIRKAYTFFTKRKTTKILAVNMFHNSLHSSKICVGAHFNDWAQSNQVFFLFFINSIYITKHTLSVSAFSNFSQKSTKFPRRIPRESSGVGNLTQSCLLIYFSYSARCTSRIGSEDRLHFNSRLPLTIRHQGLSRWQGEKMKNTHCARVHSLKEPSTGCSNVHINT